MTVPATYEEEPRHRASRWLGTKLGLLTLAIGLIPVIYVGTVFFISTVPDQQPFAQLVFGMLLSIPVVIGAMFVALVIGVWAIRKNRAPGKIMAILGMLLIIAAFAYFILGALVQNGLITFES